MGTETWHPSSATVKGTGNARIPPVEAWVIEAAQPLTKEDFDRFAEPDELRAAIETEVARLKGRF